MIVQSAVKAVRAVEPQGELTGNIHPQRHVMALAWRGVIPDQLVDQALTEEELKELGLGHIRGEFQVIEAAFAELVDDIGLVVLEDDQIHDFISGSGCGGAGNAIAQTAVGRLARGRLRGGR
jgi:hypothetical protein